MTSITLTSTNPDRLLVVDLASTSRNWALRDAGVDHLRRASPPGWKIRFVQAATSSDGDGSPMPRAQALALVGDVGTIVNDTARMQRWTLMVRANAILFLEPCVPTAWFLLGPGAL